MVSGICHRHEEIDGATIHVAEAGDPAAPASMLFLHGWPESWIAFEAVMGLLQDDLHVVALDLPGIGGSTTPPASGGKRALAQCVHGVVERLGLFGATLVGHDVGGMIAYAFLRRFPDAVSNVVIMNTAIPGIEPWDEVVANPHIWHFAFHAVPELPEMLVSGHEAAYFGYFQRALSAGPQGADARGQLHAQAYARRSALQSGFDWYRGLEQDARDNQDDFGSAIDTPVLYLRGGEEKGIALDRYVDGLRAAGLSEVRGGLVPGSGHFAPEEQPRVLADALLERVPGRHAKA